MANWGLRRCCDHEQVVFLVTISVCTVLILALWRTILLRPFKLVTVFLHEASHAIACKLTCGQVEGIQVHADEGGATQTRGGVYWLILPAGYLGSSFWGMALILASTNLLTARIAAGCFALAFLVVLFIAENWTLRGLCIGFIVFLAIIWVLQETTKFRILRYIILFIGVMNSLFSVYDIYDQLISRRDHSSDAEKFAEVCPCPCNGVGWGVVWWNQSCWSISSSQWTKLKLAVAPEKKKKNGYASNAATDKHSLTISRKQIELPLLIYTFGGYILDDRKLALEDKIFTNSEIISTSLVSFFSMYLENYFVNIYYFPQQKKEILKFGAPTM